MHVSMVLELSRAISPFGLSPAPAGKNCNSYQANSCFFPQAISQSNVSSCKKLVFPLPSHTIFHYIILVANAPSKKCSCAGAVLVSSNTHAPSRGRAPYPHQHMDTTAQHSTGHDTRAHHATAHHSHSTALCCYRTWKPVIHPLW